MLQKDVAEQLGVDKASVFNWEANTATPAIRSMPAIVDFLGYDPLPVAKGWGERLVRHRTTLGMTQKKTARGLGVDQGTLARWEQGKREPQGAFLGRVKRFLQDGNVIGRAAGWVAASLGTRESARVPFRVAIRWLARFTSSGTRVSCHQINGECSRVTNLSNTRILEAPDSRTAHDASRNCRKTSVGS